MQKGKRKLGSDEPGKERLLRERESFDVHSAVSRRQQLTVQHVSVERVLGVALAQRGLDFLENDAVGAVGPRAAPEQVSALRPSWIKIK